MTSEAWLLLAWTLVGAAWLVVHVVVVYQSLRADLAWRYRLLALVPLLSPGVAWVGRRRVAPVLWAVLLVSYAVLRLME